MSCQLSQTSTSLPGSEITTAAYTGREMSTASNQSVIARLLAIGGELVPPAPGMPRRKFDLAHMRVLLEALGNPQLCFPSVLIAGTNGKGSTAATLASILQAAGHRVGLYTSPHLEYPNERIRINGVAIPDEGLATLFTHVEASAERLVGEARLPYSPSFFETVTAIAFLHFAGVNASFAAHGQAFSLQGASAEAFTPFASTLPAASQFPHLHLPHAVDIAVLEVGMGGRLDSTNVVEPLLSILTDISLDHIGWLGSTVQEITREKAGILRQNGTLVTLPQHPEANQTIGEIAIPLGVHAINAADYFPQRSQDVMENTTLTAMFCNRYVLSLPGDLFPGAVLKVDSPLGGAHQQRNIALAIAAAIALHQQHGFTLTLETLEQGIQDTVWPGRLQLLQPPTGCPGHAPILLDAAHNPAGAWTLRAALSPLSISGPRTLVFGCMADKAITEIAQILFPVFDQVFLTQIPNARAASLEDLASATQSTGTPYRSFQFASEALAEAQASTPAHGLVVLAGSVALLGDWIGQLQDWH